MVNARVLKAAALVGATLLMPFQSWAMSVREFNAQTKAQQSEFVSKTVDKIVSDVAKVDPVLSKAIRGYFEFTPPGKDQPTGLMAFGASLRAITDLADKGKLDLDKVKTEGILLAIIKANLMNKSAQKDKQPVAPVRSETVYQFLLLDDHAQVQEIQRLCSNVVTAFSKKADGDKPIAPDAFQDRRQATNFLRALLLRGSTDARDSLYASVMFQMKETASANPFADAVDSLQTTVFEYFDKFKSASIVNESDADQQSYFLSQYIAYSKRSLDDYNKQMAEIRQRADELDKELDQKEQKLRQQMQEADCRKIRLRDGRTVLRSERTGEYIDEASKQVLHGADEAEARRNEIHLSDPATLKKYRECLATHGILNLDITAGKQ